VLCSDSALGGVWHPAGRTEVRPSLIFACLGTAECDDHKEGGHAPHEDLIPVEGVITSRRWWSEPPASNRRSHEFAIGDGSVKLRLLRDPGG
jgi:hypothetical protein